MVWFCLVFVFVLGFYFIRMSNSHRVGAADAIARKVQVDEERPYHGGAHGVLGTCFLLLFLLLFLFDAPFMHH
jgi:hypothetical protein